MGLFGIKEEKQAKAEAAQAASDRLRSLPALDLAAEVMAALGPDGMNAKSGHRWGPMEVVAWLLPGASVKVWQPTLGPVIEALGVHEHGSLVTRRSFGAGSTYHATSLGTAALAENSVRGHL